MSLSGVTYMLAAQLALLPAITPPPVQEDDSSPGSRHLVLDEVARAYGAGTRDFETGAFQAKARQCADEAVYGLFDFWLGEWDVFPFNDSSQKVGVNTIKREENGCLLTESWRARNGGTGRSMNYYDPRTGKWHQLWVDGSGTVIRIAGTFEEEAAAGGGGGAMTLVGTITTADGVTRPFKGIWTPLEDGSVRQRFEQSNDEGKTWVVWFDGKYVKRN